MPKRCVNSPNGAPAVGPYSHATAIPCGEGELLFVSGQGPFARDGSGHARGTIQEETRHALENLKMVLEDAGSGLDQVLKTTIFLVDMGAFPEVNAVYGEYFAEECPARSCIEAARLPLDIQVEIEAIAFIPKS